MPHDPTQDELFTGYRRDRENRAILDAAAVYGTPAAPIAYPPELDPRPIVRVEDQGPRNSCVGHGLSSSGEICAYIDSAGKLRPQYSRWGAYIWSQYESGLAGRDNGASISGAVQAAAKYGFCPEELWPYPPANSKYSTKIPEAAPAAARPFRLLKHAPVRSYSAVFSWINQGLGPVIIGIDWTQGLAANNGDVTLADLRTRRIGGHCVFLWGWTTDGRIYMGNSHSSQWGNAGWRLVRPEVIDHWGTTDAELHGLSDLASIDTPREIVPDYGEGM